MHACLQIGLEMLLDHSGVDPTKWAVVQIFYGGQLFANASALNAAFADATSGLNRQQACVRTTLQQLCFITCLV